MTFLDEINRLNTSDQLSIITNARPAEVRSVLAKAKLNFNDYCILLSRAASEMLEELAGRAQNLTQKFFGKTILLYAPLYLCNECDNTCAYCGFSRQLKEKRTCLSPDEALREAEIIFEKGIRHILLVSGEKRDKVSILYLQEVIARLHQKFESISLEIFPLTEEEYRQLVLAGADGLTLYQEVYNPIAYQKFHPFGPKSDYEYRLLTPERASRAGFYKINIGALLGLYSFEEEAIYLGAHAAYLKKEFWRCQIAVSFPRLKTSAADFRPPHPVSDAQMVQMICALRIFMPSIGLVISTREGKELRDNLIPLGITQMSAESKTSPGGYSKGILAEEQFRVSDERRIKEVIAAISKKGYDPVFKDWDKVYIKRSDED